MERSRSSKAQLTIAVVGSLNMDLINRLPRIPSAGETMTSNTFATGCGGKGANQAVACARLSRSRADATQRSSKETGDASVVVRMVGAVGSDSFGKDLVSSLEQNGVQTDNIDVVNDANSGVAIILVDELTGENRIILSPGANHGLKLDIAQMLDSLRPDLVVLQLEIPIAVVAETITVAKEKAIPVLLNPAPAVPLPDVILKGVTHLILNETEAAILSEYSPDKSMSKGELHEAAQGYCQRGVDYVVVTRGAEGSIIVTRDGRSGDVPARDVKALDTTAAGDTFVGSYAVSATQHPMEQNFDIQSAVERATCASAITVQRHGAQDAIPWLDELRLES